MKKILLLIIGTYLIPITCFATTAPALGDMCVSGFGTVADNGVYFLMPGNINIRPYYQKSDGKILCKAIDDSFWFLNSSIACSGGGNKDYYDSGSGDLTPDQGGTWNTFLGSLPVGTVYNCSGHMNTITIASTSMIEYDCPNQDMFFGIFLFLFMLCFMIWNFSRK